MNQYIDNKIILDPHTLGLAKALQTFAAYKANYTPPIASAAHLESTHEPVKVLTARMLEIEAQQRERALSDFMSYIERFSRLMRDLINPKGADITPEAEKEFFILRNDCLYTVDELRSVRDRYLNPLNPTILHAVEDYANKNQWSGFAFVTDAERYMNAIAKAKELAPAAFADLNSNEAQALAQYADVASFVAYANGENVD